MSKIFSSPVPVGSRLTSNFSPARKLFGIIRRHAGTDWAPPKPGQNVPIYAVADGEVIGAGVGVLAGHSGNIVVIDHGVLTDATGSDYTITNYGHLHSIMVYKGQRVKAGDQIGVMGMTGQVSGVHLHLGVRFNGLYSNPAVWLKNKGITPGVTPPVVPSINIIPASTSRPTVPVSSKYSKDVMMVQRALKNMGYDILVDGLNGPETVETIKQYQGSQHAPYRLVADGVWGLKTIGHYLWTKELQTSMNKWKGSDLKVDGHYGANTVARVRDIMNRNKDGLYKGNIDGIPGRMFCKMLGISTHP